MVAATNAWSQNPQQPYYRQDVFLPDQLIAGGDPVSDQGILTGTAVLQRGTPLGRVLYGTVVAGSGIAYPSKVVTVAALPTATVPGQAVTTFDTITFNGAVVAFWTPGYDQVIPSAGLGTGTLGTAGNPYIIPIGPGPVVIPSVGVPSTTTTPTTAQVAAALAQFIDSPLGQADAQLSKLNATVSGSVVTFTSTLPGIANNSYTMTTSNGTAFTGVGTLAGGTAAGNTGAASAITLGSQTKGGPYSAVLTSSTAFNVFDPNGYEIGQGVLGTAFTNPEINFSWASAGSPAAGDTLIILANPATAGKVKFSAPSATDGSENPMAILADYADPTGGDVNVGMYVQGQFNINVVMALADPGWSINGLKYTLQARSIYLKSVVSAADPL